MIHLAKTNFSISISKAMHQETDSSTKGSALTWEYYGKLQLSTLFQECQQSHPLVTAVLKKQEDTQFLLASGEVDDNNSAEY
jgi:hypothetical protein